MTLRSRATGISPSPNPAHSVPFLPLRAFRLWAQAATVPSFPALVRWRSAMGSDSVFGALVPTAKGIRCLPHWNEPAWGNLQLTLLRCVGEPEWLTLRNYVKVPECFQFCLKWRFLPYVPECYIGSWLRFLAIRFPIVCFSLFVLSFAACICFLCPHCTCAWAFQLVQRLLLQLLIVILVYIAASLHEH